MKEVIETNHQLGMSEKQTQSARLNEADEITRKLYPDGPKPMVVFSLSTDVLHVYSQPSSITQEPYMKNTDGLVIINYSKSEIIIYEKSSDEPLALQEVTPTLKTAIQQI